MRKYYVYVYLNTLKPGLFTYSNLSFDYEPFYVGKGFGKRYLHHLNKVKNKNKFKDSDKFQIITEIVSSGVDPIILKIKDSLSEDDALLLENSTIKSIGRNDLNTGPLTNLNDGGQKPQDNYHHTQETKDKIKEGSKKIYYTFYKLTSPDGIVYDKIRLQTFCREHKLDYQKMRKFSNRGVIKVKYKTRSSQETLNCEGWELINLKENKKKHIRKVRYRLVDPFGKEHLIYTDENAEQILYNMKLDARLLRLYRNMGKIKIKNVDQCKREFSTNIEGWEFIDILHIEKSKQYESVRKDSWIIISPCNEKYVINNLRKFCLDNKLSYRTFITFKNKGVIDMSIRKNYSNIIRNTIGWKCDEIKSCQQSIS
jgi:hypothetical protein